MSVTFAVADAFRCPVCHSDLAITDAQTGPHCRVCGFSAPIASGVIDFIPEDGGGGERAYYDDFYERTPVRGKPGALDALARTWTEPSAPWEMQRVWERLGDLRDRTVLLLGNGESYNELYLLTKRPRALIYSDLSPVGLRELRRHVDTASLGNLLFAAIDAMDLPLRDESVDLVYGFAFVHHLPDVERFLREAARVLRPGGRCVLMDNAYSPLWQHLKLGWLATLMRLSHRTQPRSPEDVRDTLAGGFREERLADSIRRVGGIPWFERVALLYYVWHRASVALFPSAARLLPRHDLISAACMRADRFLSRFSWARRNMIRLIWGFDKPRHSGADPGQEIVGAASHAPVAKGRGTSRAAAPT
jgi:SAM-dependent methyltransferase